MSLCLVYATFQIPQEYHCRGGGKQNASQCVSVGPVLQHKQNIEAVNTLKGSACISIEAHFWRLAETPKVSWFRILTRYATDRTNVGARSEPRNLDRCWTRIRRSISHQSRTGVPIKRSICSLTIIHTSSTTVQSPLDVSFRKTYLTLHINLHGLHPTFADHTHSRCT